MTAKEKTEAAARRAYEIQCRDDVCSRSTLAGLSEVFDFIPEELVTASGCLCGGTGSASGSCGAYCAGLLAVGLRFNAPISREMEHPDEDVFGETTGRAMSDYRDRFIERFGTVLCPEIHKKLFGRSFNLLSEPDRQAFFELEGHVQKCGEVVREAARIAAEMIAEDEENGQS